MRDVIADSAIDIRRVVERVEVTRPFPDVTRHVEEAITVGWKGADRRRAFEPVGSKILPGEFALPGIGHHAARRHEFVTPGKACPLEPTPCSELPFGFRRQLLSDPRREGERVFVRDLNDGMTSAPPTVALDSGRAPPVRARHPRPPTA